MSRDLLRLIAIIIWFVCIGAVAWLPHLWAGPLSVLLAAGLARYTYAWGTETWRR